MRTMPIPRAGLAACPVCHDELRIGEREVWCDAGHRFDRAREGYVNLLRPGKGRKAVIGDDADMVASRRRFLDRGHYRALAEGLRGLTRDLQDAEPVASFLDVGCGEGTFTRAMLDGLADARAAGAAEPASVAFDISRPAVRLTARRVPDALSAVASVIDMPVLDHGADLVASVMSPLHEAGFRRVARPGGRVLVVSPGDSHLAELRRVLYPHYRPHDELVALTDTFEVLEQRRFTDHVHLGTRAELEEVWGMTPYRWNTPLDGQARFAEVQQLDVSVHFLATVLRVPV